MGSTPEREGRPASPDEAVHPVWTAVDRMAAAAARVEAALQPSFFKRLLGGGSREFVRAVVAETLEEAGGVRRVLVDAIARGTHEAEAYDAIAAEGGPDAERARSAGAHAMALVGTCERLLQAVDKWREASMAHQDNAIGAEERLLSMSRRIQTLARELRSPASGIRS